MPYFIRQSRPKTTEKISVSFPVTTSRVPFQVPSKMRDPRVNCLRVISFPDGEDYSPVTYEELEADIQNNNRGQYISKLRSLNSSWPEGAVNMASPHPVLVTKQHQEQVEQLHRALVLAIEDIIGRWWSDKDARFPERMPLEWEEEELLQVTLDQNIALFRLMLTFVFLVDRQ